MKTLQVLLSVTAAGLGADELSQQTRDVDSPSPEARFTATRFIPSGELDDSIMKMRGRLSINSQERDPFGLYQVPGKEPVVKSPIAKMIKKTPFSDYIENIQISVVNSKDKEFLVGARIFRLGQVFPIVRGGSSISVRVDSIEPSAVTFKNLKTGELCAKKLDLLPAGVTASTDDLHVPGVVPHRRGDTQPLHLDFETPPPTP